MLASAVTQSGNARGYSSGAASPSTKASPYRSRVARSRSPRRLSRSSSVVYPEPLDLGRELGDGRHADARSGLSVGAEAGERLVEVDGRRRLPSPERLHRPLDGPEHASRRRPVALGLELDHAVGPVADPVPGGERVAPQREPPLSVELRRVVSHGDFVGPCRMIRERSVTGGGTNVC